MSSLPPPLTLKEIKDYLALALTPVVADRPGFGRWLDLLFTDVYGQVLGVNLYIDLKHGRVAHSHVVKLFDDMTFPGGDARWAFYNHVEGHQGDCLFNHLGGPQLLDDDQYVRVLTIKDMIDYYLRKPLRLPSLTYEAEQEVLDRFFYAPEDSREKLGVVTEIWKGKMMNVWVTSGKDLDFEISKIPELDLANIIRDRLGFSALHAGKLVRIIYPIDFDRAEVYIPTTLDASTGSLYYLSAFSGRGWGLSCCLSPTHHGLNERVHKAFDGGLTDEFEMKLLSEITNAASPNTSHLLNEAINRAR